MKKILAINLGSTSSKLAYYEDDTCVIKANLEHPAEVLKGYDQILDQYEFRKNAIEDFLKANNIAVEELDAVASRGGHTHPIVGGTYKINDVMLGEIQTGNYGRHACDIGVFIAKAMADEHNLLPLVVDPPVTDEFESLARYSGLPELPRKSSFHALNQRAAAKNYAEEQNKKYEDLNLIVVHMGGGISVAAHKKGRMVDANNALNGDGPFSTNRTGALPVGALVKMCFSGTYTEAQVQKMINGNGGMMAYIGETDLRIVLEKANQGNEQYKECVDAMMYQTCKEIGGAAAVLKGKVDAIILTGGMVHAEYICNFVKEYCGYIAPVCAYPGEFEMQALAKSAKRALEGAEKINEL